MGMFDWLRCKMPLPESRELQDAKFQTKDFGCCLDTITIAEDGSLSIIDMEGHSYDAEEQASKELANYSGTIWFYHLEGTKWTEFRAETVDGKVQSITLSVPSR